MAERRARQIAIGSDQASDVSASSEKSFFKSARSWRHHLLFSMAVTLLAGCGICSYFYLARKDPQPQRAQIRREPKVNFSPDHLFTKKELRQYDGSDESNPLLLAVVGKVFDVSAGKRHYRKGADYNGFCGRDGTRAFITGEFNDEGLTDDVTNLTDLSGVASWLKFYETDYIYVGKVIGRYYNSDGQPTVHLRQFYATVQKEKEAKAKEQEEDEKYRKLFPTCSMEAGTGIRHRVWCQTGGAYHHDFVGVPQRFFQPGRKESRCACVRTSGPPSVGPNLGTDRGDLDHPLLKPYTGCEEHVHQCYPANGEN